MSAAGTGSDGFAGDAPGARTGAEAQAAGAAVLIAGFHRSGTSVLAQVLANAGLPLGNELVPPLFSNPDGHFEDCWAVDVDTAIFNSNGATWQFDGERPLDVSAEQIEALSSYCVMRAAQSGRWAVKDPRSGFALQWWTQACPELVVVAPVRDPGACAASLRRRQAATVVRGVPDRELADALNFWTDPDLPYRMWASHHEALLQHAQRHPGRVLLVEQARLLAQPEEVLRQILDGDARLAKNPVNGALMHANSAVSAGIGLAPRTRERIAAVSNEATALGAGVIVVPDGCQTACDLAHLEAELASLLSTLDFRGSTSSAPTDSQQQTQGTESILARAQRFAARGDWLGVRRTLQGTWVEQPARASVSVLIASCHAALGEWNAALSVHAAMLSQSPQHPAATLGAMECLLIKGASSDAAAMVRQFIRIAPAEPWPWQRCARTVTRLADAQLSTDFSIAFRKRADLSSAEWVAVLALWEMRRGDVDAAAGLLAGAWSREANGGGSLLLEALSELELRQGHFDRARRILSKGFLRAHDRVKYSNYIGTVVSNVPTPHMRSDLVRSIVEELNMVRQDTAASDTLGMADQPSASRTISIPAQQGSSSTAAPAQEELCMEKIFVIGDSRTGTLSLSNFLTAAGRPTKHYYMKESNQQPHTEDTRSQNVRELLKYIRENEFTGYSDYPTRLYYKELAQKFPNGYFINTVRKDLDTWKKSMLGFFSKFGIPLDIEALVKTHVRMNAEINSYFAAHPNLRYLEICIDDGSEKNTPVLKEFLKLKTDLELSWDNRTADVRNELISGRYTLGSAAASNPVGQLEGFRKGHKGMLSEFGWVWLINDTNHFLKYLYGEMQWDDEQGRRAVATLEERRKQIGDLGARYFKFIVPEKPVVYPEYLPKAFRGLVQSAERPAVRIAQALPKLVTYFGDFLSDAKSYGSVYFRGDSHPTWLGAYLMYQEVIKRIRSSGIPVTQAIPASALKPSLYGYDGDVYTQISQDDKARLGEQWADLQFSGCFEFGVKYELPASARRARRVEPTGLLAELEFSRELLVTETDDDSLPRAVIFRDSTTDWMMDFLAEHFRRAVFVWHRGEVVGEVLEQEKPDVVLHFMAERFMVSYGENMVPISAFASAAAGDET